jgi:GNAT superfamily N-acetyltransferase
MTDTVTEGAPPITADPSARQADAAAPSFGAAEPPEVDSYGRMDETPLRVRPIRPDDWHRLQEFHSRLSLETIEARFHAMKRELSEGLAHRFTTQDGHDNVALVATSGSEEDIIAVARYCRLSPESAEVAFVVEDGWQGRGVGRRLMQDLCEMARANGVRTFVAEVLPGNIRMLRLLEMAGPCKFEPGGGELQVVVDLKPEPPA